MSRHSTNRTSTQRAWAITGQTVALLCAVTGAHGLEGFRESPRDSWTGVDKAEHVAAGVIIAAIADVGLGEAFPRMGPWTRRTMAFATAVLAGTLKEAYDSQHPRTHDASVKDWTATAAGGALGVVAIEFTFRFGGSGHGP